MYARSHPDRAASRVPSRVTRKRTGRRARLDRFDGSVSCAGRAMNERVRRRCHAYRLHPWVVRAACCTQCVAHVKLTKYMPRCRIGSPAPRDADHSGSFVQFSRCNHTAPRPRARFISSAWSARPVGRRALLLECPITHNQVMLSSMHLDILPRLATPELHRNVNHT